MRPILGFAGYSGSGKTTLIEQVIKILVGWGLRVSLIKHAHHHFDVDVPGKDSWRHRKAGAHEVLVASDQRWALMHEHRGDPEPPLEELVRHLAPCDLILVEGFKKDPVPKLEVWRRDQEAPRFGQDDPWIIALVTDERSAGAMPCLDINDPMAVSRFIVRHFNLESREQGPLAMPIRVRYFSRFREVFQRDSEVLTLNSPATVTTLITQLRARGGVWADALAETRVLRAAVNQELVSFDKTLQQDDEVALFPPVTGG